MIATVVAPALAGCVAPERPAGTVVYASGTDLESGNPLVTIHPLSRQVQRYVLFVTLARYDSSLQPVPYAARRWEWSADHRDLTFHLVQGLRWHDGPLTTARDVAFTLLAARDVATGYPRAADLAALDTVQALDDSTARLHFVAPQPSFPLVLCELPILPAHLLATVPRRELRRAPFNDAPVGNGPFRFVDRRAGARWTFARFDGFPAELGGPPRIAALVIVVVDEATTKYAGLASGDLDVAGIAPSMAALARRDPTLRVIDYPALFSVGLVFNVHRPPFDDVRVRRAIDLSIDRERIVRAALAGFGRPAGGPVPPENPLALPAAATPRHDTRMADSLLDAAGWHRAGTTRVRAGRALRADLMTVGSGDNAVEQLLQADLAARGIHLDIRQVELGAFLTQARATTKRFDLLLTGIPGDLSLSYLSAMFDGRQSGGALDYAGFHTPALDALFARTREAATPDARRDAWFAVQRELAREVPVAWIYHARGLQGVAARLENVRMDLRGELPTVARWTVSGPPLASVGNR
ncbi:MAG TPA: peptide ABC transporter substrate-binding protein [Gemmatimonadaceae bacterium]|nr:peptide ABC transporter substrate-binding protein [Gemmatimonadaceae bacterium]